jgi:hypothetical protein
MEVTQYTNLILMIFNEQQLRKYKERYYSSDKVTIFDIAHEMQADAKDLLEAFDFLDFAEAVLRQPDATLPNTTAYQKDEKLLKRL